MKLLLQRISHFQFRSFFVTGTAARDFFYKIFIRIRFRSEISSPGELENIFPKNFFQRIPANIAALPVLKKGILLHGKALIFLKTITSLGFTEAMDDYDKRKLGIFNLLNFFQLITGLIVPLAGAFTDDKLTLFSWYISSLPTFISILVLALNSARRYEEALLAYFLLYPVFTSIVYMGGMNLGSELNFILYGILSVFFIQEISHMLFSLALSMISYFVLSVVLDDYRYQLHSENIFLYFWNQAIAVLFIFYGLFLIKKENAVYQSRILAKSEALQNKNTEIRKQKREIAEKAGLLKRQTAELTELNALKNKLFSVIAHDLKSPMYALQNLFLNMKKYNLPAEEVKQMIPDVLNDLNYTTGLMENLLQWAKSQMESNLVRLQQLEINQMISGVVKLLRLQSEAKEITVEIMVEEELYAMGDREMINLVLRNLLSNSIKFTCNGGIICIGAEKKQGGIHLFVQDNGIGMSEAALQKLNKNDYYSTRGTASESGTGLGLMLCKEFLEKNGSHLAIESTEGHGSIFSFTLDGIETMYEK